MAEVAGESWWIKLGVMFDKSGFKAAAIGMADLKSIAEGLANTFKKVVDANTDLYYASRTLNMSTRELQIWERAFNYVGGSSEEARQNINNLNYAFEELQLGMGGAKAAIAARLHLMPQDLISMETAMAALNRSFNTAFKRDRGYFTPLARQLGLSESAIQLVTLSVDEYQAKLRKANSVPLIPEKNIAAARQLKEQFTQLSIQWENFKSNVMSTSFPALSKLFRDLESVLTNPEFQQGLTEFFTKLEEGFDTIINDVDHKQLIENMTTISRAILEVAKWTAKGVGGTIETTKNTASGLGTLTNKLFGDKEIRKAIEENAARRGKALMSSVDVLANPSIAGRYGMYGMAGEMMVDKSIGQLTVNVYGVHDAKNVMPEVQKQLTNVARQRTINQQEDVQGNY